MDYWSFQKTVLFLDDGRLHGSLSLQYCRFSDAAAAVSMRFTSSIIWVHDKVEVITLAKRIYKTTHHLTNLPNFHHFKYSVA